MNYLWVYHLRTGFGYLKGCRPAKIATYNFWGTNKKISRFGSFWYQTIPIIPRGSVPFYIQIGLLSFEKSAFEKSGFAPEIIEFQRPISQN